MASPLLLGDAVEALITARTGKEDISAEALRVLRDNILPGGVERLTKVRPDHENVVAVIHAVKWPSHACTRSVHSPPTLCKSQQQIQVI